MRLLSWNLLRDGGATADDVARLVERHRPDLLLMQEATALIESLPRLLGHGQLHRHVMPGRANGPAAWSSASFSSRAVLLPLARTLDLPTPALRGVRRRVAQLLDWRSLLVANVHLDHGQRANRRQLRAILAAGSPPDLIAGDFNMIGSPGLPGFHDAGPRTWTHLAWGSVPFRLDRCLLRRHRVVAHRALRRGRSDHRPILLELEPFP